MTSPSDTRPYWYSTAPGSYYAGSQTVSVPYNPSLRKWSPYTFFGQGEQVVNPSGQIVAAINAFNTGATYDAGNWTLQNDLGSSSSGASLPSQSGNAGKVLGTDGTNVAWSAAGTIDTSTVPLPPMGAGNPGSGTAGASPSDHVHPALFQQSVTATGNVVVPVAGLYEIEVIGSGGGGGGAGSAAQTSGVTAQAPGAAGGSGVRQSLAAQLSAGTTINFQVAAGGTAGVGGAASTGSTGNAGTNGGQGSSTIATWTGGQVSAAGGGAGNGSAANSASFPSQGNAGQPYYQQGGWPGCGGNPAYGGQSPGAIAPGVGTGGGAGGPATSTKGGGGGQGGSRTNAQANGGSSGASASTAGVDGTVAEANSGGGGAGGGGGAPGGKGGNGSAGAAGRGSVRQLT